MHILDSPDMCYSWGPTPHALKAYGSGLTLHGSVHRISGEGGALVPAANRATCCLHRKKGRRVCERSQSEDVPFRTRGGASKAGVKNKKWLLQRGSDGDLSKRMTPILT